MASGDTLLIFTPLNNEPKASAYATLDLRNNHPVLDFNDGAYGDAGFTGILPRAYSGGGLTVAVFFAMSIATSGDVFWKAQIERIGEVLDIDANGYAGFQVIKATASETCGIPVKAEITFTDGAQMDSLVAGEPFKISIRRDGTDVNDTASGDAELLAVEIKET